MAEFIILAILVGIAVYLINAYSSYEIRFAKKDDAMEAAIREEARAILARAAIEQKAVEIQAKMLDEVMKNGK